MFAVERSPRIDPRPAIRMAQVGQRLCEPRSGNGLAPVDVVLRRGRIPGNSSPRQQTHRLAERQPVGCGAPLNRLELIEGPAQPFVRRFRPTCHGSGPAHRIARANA